VHCGSPGLGFQGRRVEIARAADGLDAFAAISSRSKLAAEITDVDINAAVEGSEVAAEDRMSEILALEDDTRGRKKKFEEIKFDGGEIEFVMVAANDAGSGAEFEVTDAHEFFTRRRGITGLGFIAAAEDGVNARGEFAGIERFWKVIIGTDFEAENAVDFFTAGRQHDNGDAGGSADFLENVEAAKARKHNIENKKGVVSGERFFDGVRASVHRVELKTLGLEILGEQFAKLGVVVDDEKAANERTRGRGRFFQRRHTKSIHSNGVRQTPQIYYCN
jgi:hypothetical protein